jgi:hypothetical protein
MRRRDFIKGIAASAAGWPIALHAQSAGAMQQVGSPLLLATADEVIE